jgi:hypothetical protein
VAGPWVVSGWLGYRAVRALRSRRAATS